MFMKFLRFCAQEPLEQGGKWIGWSYPNKKPIPYTTYKFFMRSQVSFQERKPQNCLGLPKPAQASCKTNLGHSFTYHVVSMMKLA